ncbi:MAG TPA: DoxX family protein [Lunatimonas sp.]|nr:DoxX family protein [Lunatimonas sp.]
MKKKKIAKILIIILGLDLILSGVLFMFGSSFGVDDFNDIIDRLGYPQYILGAIGFGKLLMGIALLFAGHFRWRTYAYFALAVNLFLALYSHVSAGDGLVDMASALLTLLFAGLVFYLDFKSTAS